MLGLLNFCMFHRKKTLQICLPNLSQRIRWKNSRLSEGNLSLRGVGGVELISQDKLKFNFYLCLPLIFVYHEE